MTAVIEGAAPVVEVLVLEDRARVIRRGTVELAEGQARVVVRGVAPVLVDKTLTASVVGAGTGTEAETGTGTGAARVIDARCVRRLAPWRTGAAAGDGASAAARGAAALAADEARAADEVARLEGAVAIAERELGDVARLRAVAHEELAVEAAWGRASEAAAGVLARLDERERAATVQVVTRRHALERARRDLAALRARIAAARDDAGVEAADVEIDVVAARAGAVTLEVEYLVPGACWRPYHTATLTGDEVTIATDACVWQHTGEDWREATLSFSTERPSLGAEPPRLVDDELRVQRKSEVVHVEARDQDIDTTSLGSERATETAAQVPGVDDGGVATTLRAPHPATVPTDGRPYRVALGAHTAPAEVALVAVPERSPCAFTRTRQAGGGRPLLAGPVDLVRDAGHVGRTSILYVAAHERFELGWGPEPDVRLHRDERRTREDGGMLSSWTTTRVRVAVRLSNLGDRPRVVEVTERVPVSELDKVEIAVSPADGRDAWRPGDDDGAPADADAPVVTARTIDDDGLVRWQVELPPRGRRVVALEYRIRAHGSVVGL